MKTHTKPKPEPKPICKAKTRHGTPCRMKPGASGYCFAHDPERDAARTSARRRGGLRRAGLLARAVLSDRLISNGRTAIDEAGPVELRTPDEVRGLLAETIQHARTGRLDCRIAATVGSLAGVLLRAVEQGELETRLAAIEAALAQGQAQRGAA